MSESETKIGIRLATQYDLWQIIDYLQTQSLPYVAKGEIPKGFWYGLATIISNKGFAYVAHDETDKMIGYIVHDQRDIRFLEVIGGFRKRGIGKLLVKKAEEELVLSTTKLEFTVSINAEDFWRKCGYTVVDSFAVKELTNVTN